MSLHVILGALGCALGMHLANKASNWPAQLGWVLLAFFSLMGAPR